MHRWLFICLLAGACNPGSVETYNVGNADGGATSPTDASNNGTTVTPTDMGSTTDDQGMTTQDMAQPPDMTVELPVEDVITAEADGTLKSFAFDRDTGELQLRDTDTSSGRFSFAAFHPTLPIVYGTSDATVRAYSFDENSGALAFLSSGASADNGTHLEVDQTASYVFTVSYGGHSMSMLPLDGNGEPQNSVVDLGGATDAGFCQNAHQVRVHPDNEFVYVPCLGSDFVRIPSFDANAGTLESVGTADVPSGAGPRHMDFHPTLDRAYVLNETASSITIFDLDTTTGMLSNAETVTTMPPNESGGSASSDIHFAPGGAHLYAVNRQPLHQIAMFSVDASGDLTSIGHVDGMGEHSRSFALDASGRWLLLGNRNTDDLVTFERNESTGQLSFVREMTNFAGSPMFVGFRAR